MRNFTIINIVVLLIFSFAETVNSQIVISKPNLGFTQACASPSFNTYYVTFTFSPETELTATNQFIVELSDEAGNFTNPTVIYTSNQGEITTSPATIGFSLPNTIAGEAFKVKIKSTSPAASSTGSNAFAAYYKIQDTPFSINNLVETGVYCSGGSYLLTIDNPGNADNDSPLKYPALTFNWYKETSPTTSVFVASGETLSVSEPGTYFAETNYGSCTSNSYSNRVKISEVTSGTTNTAISSSLGNPYCAAEGETALSTINGSSYQWYKDGELIAGATSQMYKTSESGTYNVVVNLGSCTSTASIDLETTGFSSSINVPEINNVKEGETLTATVTTDAVNPVFTWYLNDVVIPNASGNTYTASQFGVYKVVVNQTSGCQASNEFTFTITEPFPNVEKIPNLISPNGDGINDTWVIPQAYVSGSNTEVVIMTSTGEVVFSTTDYQNNWPTEQIGFNAINPVYYYIITTANKQVKKGSITIVK